MQNPKDLIDSKCALTNLHTEITNLKVSSNLENSYVDTKVLKELYPAGNAVDSESQNSNYNLHPTYSFRGYHENMVLGFLGSVSLNTPAVMTAQNFMQQFIYKERRL